MIRLLLRLAIGGAVLAWLADRWLGARDAGPGKEPVRTLVVIDAPIEQVWRELADVERQPRWMRDLKAVRILTKGPIGVGTKAEGDIRIFGVEVTDPITITAFEPPRRFGIRHEGQFRGEGVIELEPGADGTTTVVRWQETIVPPYLPDLGAELLRPILQQVFQADLDRLRNLVETGAGAG